MGMGHAGGSPLACSTGAPASTMRILQRDSQWCGVATTSFTLLDMCAPNGRGSGLRWEDDPTNFLVAFDPRMEH